MKEEIEKYHKMSTSRKPFFFLSAYVMDVFYTTSFSAMGWEWTKASPLVHILLFKPVGGKLWSLNLWNLWSFTTVNVLENLQRRCSSFLGKGQIFYYSKWWLVCRRIFLLHSDLGQQYSSPSAKNSPKQDGFARNSISDGHWWSVMSQFWTHLH